MLVWCVRAVCKAARRQQLSRCSVVVVRRLSSTVRRPPALRARGQYLSHFLVSLPVCVVRVRVRLGRARPGECASAMRLVGGTHKLAERGRRRRAVRCTLPPRRAHNTQNLDKRFFFFGNFVSCWRVGRRRRAAAARIWPWCGGAMCAVCALGVAVASCGGAALRGGVELLCSSTAFFFCFFFFVLSSHALFFFFFFAFAVFGVCVVGGAQHSAQGADCVCQSGEQGRRAHFVQSQGHCRRALLGSTEPRRCSSKVQGQGLFVAFVLALSVFCSFYNQNFSRIIIVLLFLFLCGCVVLLFVCGSFNFFTFLFFIFRLAFSTHSQRICFFLLCCNRFR